MGGLGSWGVLVHSQGVRSSAMVVTQSFLDGYWVSYWPLRKALGQILGKLTGSLQSCSQDEPEEHAGAGSGEIRNVPAKIFGQGIQRRGRGEMRACRPVVLGWSLSGCW